MQRTLKYEEMLPSELAQAVERMPVFFLATGLLEWHGDHLPPGPGRAEGLRAVP